MAKLVDNDFFDKVLNRKFGPKTCFLCGCRLTKKNRTEEHVIPRWLQKKYQLYDQRLNLLNGTTIPYRNLTIPCCFSCNNLRLEPLEKRISDAVALGAGAVRAVNHHDLFLWLGKIFYGLLYRELFLSLDRTGKLRGNITDRKLLRRFEMHHLFLQSVRTPMQFSAFSPASIMVVNTQEPSDIRLRWDFRDEIQTMCIACRMGPVGLIAVLQDGGAQEPCFSDLKLRRRRLHPIQFREVVARVMYKAMLFNRTPKYVIIEGQPVRAIQHPLEGLSGAPLFEQWNQQHYAQVLSQITGVPMKQLFVPPDSVMTWLHNSDGKAKSLPLRLYPV